MKDDQSGQDLVDERSKFRKTSQVRFQGPAAEAIRSDVDVVDMDLVDWMNPDHFPPLNSS
jgi:hypothetical protein